MRLLKTFLSLKLAQLLVLYGVPYQFDVSLDLVVEDYQLDEANVYFASLLKKFLIWDNVYFTDLFKNEIKYEHQFVFSPGWVAFVRYLGSLVPTNNFYLLLSIATLVSNGCQLLTSIILFYYSKMVFSRILLFKHKADSLASVASVYYLLSPGGIFLTALYSENFGSFLSILALYYREKSINYDSNYQLKIQKWAPYFASGLLVSLSFQVRANCLLLGIFYLYDVATFWLDSNVTDSVISLFSGLPLFGSFVYSNYVNYTTFCPERGEWCNSLFPSLFLYCQVHYWNNGFLNYWSLSNLPNFLIAFPILTANTYLIWQFIIHYPSKLFLPYLILNGILVVAGLFFWNVQILNRILNFNPIFYWFLAVNDHRYIKLGLISWILFQAGLFGAHLPPA